MPEPADLRQPGIVIGEIDVIQSQRGNFDKFLESQPSTPRIGRVIPISPGVRLDRLRYSMRGHISSLRWV